MERNIRELNERNCAIQNLNKFTTINRRIKDRHFILILLFKSSNITNTSNDFKRSELPVKRQAQL